MYVCACVYTRAGSHTTETPSSNDKLLDKFRKVTLITLPALHTNMGSKTQKSEAVLVAETKRKLADCDDARDEADVLIEMMSEAVLGSETQEEVGIDKTPVVASLDEDGLADFLDDEDDFDGGREAARRARENHTQQRRVE